MATSWALSLPTATSSTSSSSSIIMFQHSVLPRYRSTSSLRSKPIRCGSGRRASTVSPPPLPRHRHRPPPRTSSPARSSGWQKEKKQQGGAKVKKRDDNQKRRHWKEGEFPGIVPDQSLVMRERRKPPIKNIKKKLDDRLAAKAWVPTVTETLSDRISKKLWQEALEDRVRKDDCVFILEASGFSSKKNLLLDITVVYCKFISDGVAHLSHGCKKLNKKRLSATSGESTT